MTREELETSLAKIGWRIDKSGNGLNDYIINDKNEVTSFVVRGNFLEVRKYLFGKSSFNGSIHFELSDLIISEGSALGIQGVVDYVCINFSTNCFIQFFKNK